MSTIGKIFVVLNLALSLLLLGSLGALLSARVSTQEDVERLETALADKETELEQLASDNQAKIRGIENDKRNLENANDDLEVKAENLDRSVKKLELDNQQLRDDVSKMTASLELLQEDLSARDARNSELQDSNDDLRSQAIDAREEARQAEMARRDLQGRISGYERQIADLDDELTVALERAREAEMLVDVARTAGFNPAMIVATPAIDAQVAQVDNDVGFVILDKGAADSVERGFVFDVYRGTDYLGQVTVDQVHDRHATASITLPRGDIRRFDRATTRL